MLVSKHPVILAEARIQSPYPLLWIPAFAGMTISDSLIEKDF